MSVERIWRWLVGFTTARDLTPEAKAAWLDLERVHEQRRKLDSDLRTFLDKFSQMEGVVTPTLGPLLDKPHATDAGEPRTENTTTPTCESTASDWQPVETIPLGVPIEIRTVHGLTRWAKSTSTKIHGPNHAVHCWSQSPRGDAMAVAWRHL